MGGRFLSRVAGCAAGAVYAGVVLALAHLSPLATAPVLLAGTALGVMLGRHVENGAGALAYAGTQVVLAILVTLVPDSYARAELTPALDRLGGILIGMVLLEPVLLAASIITAPLSDEEDDEEIFRLETKSASCVCVATAVSACAMLASVGETARREASVVPSMSWRTR